MSITNFLLFLLSVTLNPLVMSGGTSWINPVRSFQFWLVVVSSYGSFDKTFCNFFCFQVMKFGFAVVEKKVHVHIYFSIACRVRINLFP